MKEYRIIRNTVMLSNGEIRHNYTVEFKSKFLWFSWWRELGFTKWGGTIREYEYELMYDHLIDHKFKHKSEAEKFICELTDCEANKFNFEPIIRGNKVCWVDPLCDGTFYSIYKSYETLKNKELRYREDRQNKVVIVKHTKEVV